MSGFEETLEQYAGIELKRRACAKALEQIEPIELEGTLLMDVEEVEEALGLDSPGSAFFTEQSVKRLASLIDRGTCLNLSSQPGGFQCSECGFPLSGSQKDVLFCPGCGRQVCGRAGERNEDGMAAEGARNDR